MTSWGLNPKATFDWSRWTLVSVCILAVCVNLGTALVSLSEALLLLAFLGQLWCDGPHKTLNWLCQAPKVVWLIGAAISWFALTIIWTEAATLSDALIVLYGHARLAWIVIALYLVATPKRAWVVLQWVMAGQTLVLMLSWLLWLGLPLPWTTTLYPPESGVAFTSTLEQPVMSTLLTVLLWGFRERLLKDCLPRRFGKFLLYSCMLAAIANVFFVLTGRTGYLVMMVFLSFALVKALSRRARPLIILLPALAVFLLFQFSDRFHHRLMEVRNDVIQYKQGTFDSSNSQGLRLDNWRVSVQGIEQRPWLGHGVGSFAKVYETLQGHENRTVRDPHQQYLFWWVEGGLVAFALLLGIFGALVRDSRYLSPDAKWSLICTTAIAATMSLANCPIFGIGMGEFFFGIMAALLGMTPAPTSFPKPGAAQKLNV